MTPPIIPFLRNGERSTNFNTKKASTKWKTGNQSTKTRLTMRTSTAEYFVESTTGSGLGASWSNIT